MWAAPDETRDFITGLYRRAWQHADATIAELPLDAPATIPWWGEDAEATLGHILVHMTTETQRHGHPEPSLCYRFECQGPSLPSLSCGSCIPLTGISGGRCTRPT
jgi:hypothetical protein